MPDGIKNARNWRRRLADLKKLLNNTETISTYNLPSFDLTQKAVSGCGRPSKHIMNLLSERWCIYGPLPIFGAKMKCWYDPKSGLQSTLTEQTKLRLS